uniref:CARD domain-containing protein n=1 Tax=Magallana gigas TaxID=29159 RepID=A0A8W8L988_MAGGI
MTEMSFGNGGSKKNLWGKDSAEMDHLAVQKGYLFMLEHIHEEPQLVCYLCHLCESPLSDDKKKDMLDGKGYFKKRELLKCLISKGESACKEFLEKFKCYQNLYSQFFNAVQSVTNADAHRQFSICRSIKSESELLKIRGGFFGEGDEILTICSKHRSVFQKTSCKHLVKRMESDKEKTQGENEFEVVESSGHKLDPEDVTSKMRRVRNAEGKRIFRIDEFLSGNQVSSYFCRLDLKRRRIHVVIRWLEKRT